MSDKKKTVAPFTITSQKIWEIGLTPIEGFILLRIMFWVGKSKTQECFESRASISQTCKVSEPIVTKTLAELEKLNIIEIERGKAKGKSNRLRIKQETLWQARPQVENQTPKKRGGSKEVSTLGSKEVSTLRGEGVVRRFLPGSKEVTTRGGKEVSTKENRVFINKIDDRIELSPKEEFKEIELKEINNPTGSVSSPSGTDVGGEESALDWFARMAEMPWPEKIEMTQNESNQLPLESHAPVANLKPILTKKESKKTNQRKALKEARQEVFDVEVIDDNQSPPNESWQPSLLGNRGISETQSIALVPIMAQPAKRGREKKPKPEAPTAEAWQAYVWAMKQRYKETWEPTRCSQTNSQMKKFCEKVGYELAPKIIEFYVFDCNDAFFVQNYHPIGIMLQRAETLKSGYLCGGLISRRMANNIEKSSTLSSDLDRIIEEMNRK